MLYNKRSELWSIGVFRVENFEDFFCSGVKNLVHFINQPKIRKNLHYQSTSADPFLFADSNNMYLFYESKSNFANGEIWLQSMSKDGIWTNHGCVLKESFHLSYPQVFEHNEKIFMIPEAAQSGSVFLYEAVDFPHTWKRSIKLIDSPLRDPTLYIKDNNYFIFATTEYYQLKMFHSEKLQQLFTDTGIIITDDKAVARCAGYIFQINKRLIRPAQDCTDVYGKKIILQEIVKISKTEYKEIRSLQNIQHQHFEWMREGSHHISSVIFNGNVYIATDGKCKDSMLNTLLLFAFRYMSKLLRLLRHYFGNHLIR